MGDGDEEPGAFLEGFAVQVHGAVFGDDPLHVGPGRDDAGAGFQRGDDLGGEFRRTRGQGDDGLAPFGHLGAADEVQLAAGPGVDARADGVGAHLAG